eukprot:GAHX01000788.1.p1 GENE.GAHX01000788.1~~GAHX01000788.1.p1  ORF type:complete len:122 (-),score=45.52 GAHX01000788.1:114-479(-)
MADNKESLLVFECVYSKDKRKKKKKWLDGTITTNLDGTNIIVKNEEKWKVENYKNKKKPKFVKEKESVELNWTLVEVGEQISGECSETVKEIEESENDEVKEERNELLFKQEGEEYLEEDD